jgi:hypothetical protein
MAFHISDFKNAFLGGTRQNRFYVEGTIPGGNGNLSKFHIKTTQIPSVTTLVTEYQYFGRKAFYPGEKQYGSWSMIVLDDVTENGNLWKKFNKWQNLINNHTSNNSITNTSYKANDWKIRHLNINGDESEDNILKTFILQGCWPKVIEPINFNMTNPNLLNQFTVIFVYDYLEIEAQGSNITASL